MPDFVSATLGGGLLVLAHGLLYSSARIFNGKPPVFLAGAFGAFAWLFASESHLLATSAEATSIFVCLLIGSYSFLLALEFRQMASEKLHSSPVAATLAVIHGLFFFGLGVLILTWASGGKPITFADSWSAVVALEAVIATAALAYVLLSLSKERVVVKFRGAALTDDLTGIANRRAFFERGEEIALEGKTLRLTTSLMLIDLDGFKQINDKCGHPAGDKILRAVAICVSGSLPAGAVLARLGGDEFAALIPRMDLGIASVLAERIRERIYGLTFAIDAERIEVTVSIGVAESTEGLINLLELISAADAALYIAKANGRNRVQAHSLAEQHLFELGQAGERSAKMAAVRTLFSSNLRRVG